MRRWTKRILIVLAVFVLPVAALYFYMSWQGERELRAVIEELDATGEPWRWEDLAAALAAEAASADVWPVVVAARQQAPRSLFNNKVVEAALYLPPNIAIAPDEYESFRDATGQAKSALTEARKLATIPKGRVHIRWQDQLIMANYDDVQKMRELILVQQCGVTLRSQQGDLDSAMDDCMAMQHLSQSLRDEPTMFVHLVRIAMQTITLESLERVLAQGEPSKGQLERLQQALQEVDAERALRASLCGERACLHRQFEALAAGRVSVNNYLPMKIPGTPIWESLNDLYLRTNVKQAHAWALRHITAVMDSLDLPEPERTDRQQKLDKSVLQAPGAARYLTGPSAKVMNAHRRSQANLGCGSAALAAERFRRDQHRWPQTLGELCPKYIAKISDDPYTRTELLLRTTGDGIVIYSVGPDGQQRGTCQEDRAANRTGVRYEFRLWDVPSRRTIVLR